MTLKFKSRKKRKLNDTVMGLLCVLISVFFISVVIYKSFETTSKEQQYNSIKSYQTYLFSGIDNYEQIFVRATIQLFEIEDLDEYISSRIERTDFVKKKLINKIEEFCAYYDLNGVEIVNEKKNELWRSFDMEPHRLDEYQDTKKLLSSMNYGKGIISGRVLNNNDYNTYFLFKSISGYIVIFHCNSRFYTEEILSPNVYDSANTWLYYNDYFAFTDRSRAEEDDLIDINTLKDGEFAESGDYIYRMCEYRNYKIITRVSKKLFKVKVYSDLKIWLIIFLVFLGGILMVVLFEKIMNERQRKYNEAYHMVSKSANEYFEKLMIYKLFSGGNLDSEGKQLINDRLRRKEQNGVIIMYIRIDAKQNLYEQFDEQEINVARYGIMNIVDELMTELGDVKIARVKDDYFGVILYPDIKLSKDSIKKRIELVSSTVQEIFGVGLSYIICNREIKGYSEMKQCMEKIDCMRHYWFISGECGVVFAEDIPEVLKNAQYPQKIEDKILDAVYSKNFEEFLGQWQEFCQYIEKNSYVNATAWCEKLCRKIMEIYPDAIKDPYEIYKLGCIADIYEIIESAFFVKGMDKDRVEEAFAIKARKYIDENYADNQCCVAELARVLNMTPAYTGQKFKICFGKMFNDYLMEYRCEKAVHLLLTTSKRVKEIATLCGFNTDTYFSSIFKKIYNLTPQRYRVLKGEAEK